MQRLGAFKVQYRIELINIGEQGLENVKPSPRSGTVCVEEELKPCYLIHQILTFICCMKNVSDLLD